MNAFFFVADVSLVSVSNGVVSWNPAAVVLPVVEFVAAALVAVAVLCVMWCSVRHLVKVLKTPAYGGAGSSGADDGMPPNVNWDLRGRYAVQDPREMRSQPNSMFAANTVLDPVGEANYRRDSENGKRPAWAYDY